MRKQIISALFVVLFTFLLYVPNMYTEKTPGIRPSVTAGVIYATNNIFTSNENCIDGIKYEPAEVQVVSVQAQFDYSTYGLNEHEIKVNEQIFDIKQSDLTDKEKIVEIGKILATESDTTYFWGGCLFTENNEFIDNDFNTPGLYYKDGMELDCSSFIQYLVYIATVHDDFESRTGGIILGRTTYFQTVEGTETNNIDICTLCFRFNGGSGVTRDGSDLGSKEVFTEDANHVAIYLGNGDYLDCSSNANGIRISNINDKPGLKTFYTYYRNLPDAPYVSTLEQNL